MKFRYWSGKGFEHSQDIEFNKVFYVIGSELTYEVVPTEMRYKITVEDDGVPVCEIKFNDHDLANIIGEQLTRLIGGIMEPPTDEMRAEWPMH